MFSDKNPCGHILWHLVLALPYIMAYSLPIPAEDATQIAGANGEIQMTIFTGQKALDAAKHHVPRGPRPPYAPPDWVKSYDVTHDLTENWLEHCEEGDDEVIATGYFRTSEEEVEYSINPYDSGAWGYYDKPHLLGVAVAGDDGSMRYFEPDQWRAFMGGEGYDRLMAVLDDRAAESAK